MNETAVYRELAAPPPLRAAVACLWLRDSPPDVPPNRVLPDGCSDLIWQSGRGAHVAGPDTGAWLADGLGGSAMVGVRFRPGAGGPALGLPLEELRDRRVELADLLPAAAAELTGDLPADEAARRLGRLATDLVAAGPPDPLVRRAAGLLAAPHARTPSVAAELGLSERQLRRRCHAAVGYGPKTLARVLRLRRFLALRAADPVADLAGLALDAGYSDQAHLGRDCLRLTGLTPAAPELATWAAPARPVAVAAQKGGR